MTVENHILLEILDNSSLSWGLIACGFAQLSKLIFEFIKNRELNFSVLIETGGMPSSHSALVTGTASGVGFDLGFDHPAFAFSAAIAFIIMYDASGVRREAGLIAKKVNLLFQERNENKDSQDFLKERLGHSRLEVLVGSVLGPTIALPGMFFIGSPLHLAQSLGLLMG